MFLETKSKTFGCLYLYKFFAFSVSVGSRTSIRWTILSSKYNYATPEPFLKLQSFTRRYTLLLWLRQTSLIDQGSWIGAEAIAMDTLIQPGDNEDLTRERQKASFSLRRMQCFVHENEHVLKVRVIYWFSSNLNKKVAKVIENKK